MTINLADPGPTLPPRHGRGPWMQTWLGFQFFPLDPHEDEIHIEEIAHALSNLCRYNGHVEEFYSVAEHCVALSYAVPPEYAMEALLHDASEAFLGDMIRPLKINDLFYQRVEAQLVKVIARKFGMPEELSPVVKEYDTRILVDERQKFMADPPAPWFGNEQVEPLGVDLVGLTPKRARSQFMTRFHLLERKARLAAK